MSTSALSRRAVIEISNSKHALQPAVFKEQLGLVLAMLIWDDHHSHDLLEYLLLTQFRM